MGRRRVYVVSSGEYSDYSVGSVFERREDAEAAVAAGLASEVEERVLFSDGEMPKRKVRWSGVATLRLDGRPVEAPRAWSYVTWDDDLVAPASRRLTVEVTERSHAIFVRADGSSQEAVIKAVSDRFAKIRAERSEPPVAAVVEPITQEVADA